METRIRQKIFPNEYLTVDLGARQLAIVRVNLIPSHRGLHLNQRVRRNLMSETSAATMNHDTYLHIIEVRRHVIPGADPP